MGERPSGPLAAADRVLAALAGLFAIAGAAGILVLLGVTVVAVVWRYWLNAPIFGIEDVSVLALTFVAAAAVVHGGRRGAHVSINVVDRVLPPVLVRVTDALMRALAAGIAFIAAWALFAKSCGMEKACITSNLGIEHRAFYWVLGVAMGLYGASMLLALVRGLAGARR